MMEICPISIFSGTELGINCSELKGKYSEHYEETYEWDFYLRNQLKLDFISKNLMNFEKTNLSMGEVRDYYLGNLEDNYLLKKLPPMSQELTIEFNKIVPFRKRLVSEFKVYKKDNYWYIERIKTTPFSQTNATIRQEKLDYRLFPRVFKELPDDLVDDNLKSLIKYSVSKIEAHRSIKEINCVVHHTIIFSENNTESTNSPERIHQDGMPYIVSAFVVERSNIIDGGESKIYLEGEKNPFLNISLQEGQGIFQPDLNTKLWHEVTPIKTTTTGFRSTIGLDLTVIK